MISSSFFMAHSRWHTADGIHLLQNGTQPMEPTEAWNWHHGLLAAAPSTRAGGYLVSCKAKSLGNSKRWLKLGQKLGPTAKAWADGKSLASQSDG